MKLLFDNNLSHKLIIGFNDIFPRSSHVMLEGLDESSDLDIWNFAQANDFTIVSKDSDFDDLITLRGHPPKVIWLRIGNCKVKDVEEIIRNNMSRVIEFLKAPDIGIIEID